MHSAILYPYALRNNKLFLIRSGENLVITLSYLSESGKRLAKSDTAFDRLAKQPIGSTVEWIDYLNAK